ncbi:MAG TPA: ROK family protein [Actinomycetes bacterium]|jgi:glucokinase|nr:ROK family protein [Actinomycetes bacterium]
MGTVLALDIGGTKLASAVIDDTGRILGRGRVPSPTGTDPEPLYEALVACAAAALRGADVLPGDLVGIGVAAAGPMVWPSGEVSPLNMPAWRGFPLRKRLAEEFDSERVLIHNDAVGLAVGEHWKGAGVGTSNLLGITVSTGVGGGLILAGRLYHGTSGNAGHVGHVVVEPDGPVCACGGRGCLEAIASGPNTVRHALDEGWRPRPGVVADGVALAAAAATGDAVALRSVARAGRAVGTAIASCANLLDLEVAAIVGGFSQSGPPFWEPLQQAFATHASFPFAAACRVIPGQLVGTAGLLGAAAFVLIPDRYGWDPDPAPGH